MVKIKILRNTVVNGKTVFAGESVSASKADAGFLVSMKKAEYEDVDHSKKDSKKPSGKQKPDEKND